MDKRSEALGPILTAHLIPKVESKLIELLGLLTPEDWERPTISPRWNVKDVASHLLDTQLRKLSIARDCYVTEIPVIHAPADLAGFIDRLNQGGVGFFSRLSPKMLISLMEVASTESAKYHLSLNPFAPAIFAVSWAGEETSLNWFDTARELTERWHHQQQIRLAVNRPGIMVRELYHPVLDCFMRALPYTYQNIGADPGTLLQFDISGECGGTWCLHREGDRWRLVIPSLAKATSRVTIRQEIAWRVFTKGIDRESALAQTQVEGDPELGLHILRMIAIVA